LEKGIFGGQITYRETRGKTLPVSRKGSAGQELGEKMHKQARNAD